MTRVTARSFRTPVSPTERRLLAYPAAEAPVAYTDVDPDATVSNGTCSLDLNNEGTLESRLTHSAGSTGDYVWIDRVDSEAGSELPSGAYVVRAAGETFHETRTLTLAR